jgi:hypothetical protein
MPKNILPVAVNGFAKLFKMSFKSRWTVPLKRLHFFFSAQSWIGQGERTQCHR